MVEYIGVVGQIQVAVDIDLLPSRILVGGGQIARRQRLLQILADGDVHQCQIKHRFFFRELSFALPR